MHMTSLISTSQTQRSCFALKPFRAPAPRNTPAVRVFVFSFAGGSVTALRGLLEGLPSCFEVIGVELPGRGLTASSPLCWDLEDLLAQLEVDVAPWLTPTSLFLGYSFGGLLASELIRRFQAQAFTIPAGLICFSSKAPRLVVQDQPWANLSEPGLIQRLRMIGGIPEVILRSDECMRLALPSIQADLQCFGQYAVYHDRPLECPVMAFRGEQDPFLGSLSVEDWQFEVAEQHWAQSAIHVLDGGHFCHLGNEAAIRAALIQWAGALGLLPEGLPLIKQEALRFVWNPLLSGDHA